MGFGNSLPSLSVGRAGTCITRWYQTPAGALTVSVVGPVRSDMVRSGQAGNRPHDLRTGVRQTGAAVEGARGCTMFPIPRGIGETTYTIAPNTMIDNTLITQSRIVIAVASANGTP